MALRALPVSNFPNPFRDVTEGDSFAVDLDPTGPWSQRSVEIRVFKLDVQHPKTHEIDHFRREIPPSCEITLIVSETRPLQERKLRMLKEVLSAWLAGLSVAGLTLEVETVSDNRPGPESVTRFLTDRGIWQLPDETELKTATAVGLIVRRIDGGGDMALSGAATAQRA